MPTNTFLSLILLQFTFIYGKLFKERKWFIMNKKVKKIVAWIMVLLMVGSVIASILIYAL